MLVNFIIIGAQKSGTTSLASQLSGHPEICFSSEKEPQFFNSYTDWKRDVDEYHNLFAPAEGQICGEASTMYTFFPEFLDTHERIYEYNPKMKIIYIMRQPVERVISNYAHNQTLGLAKIPHEKDVLENPVYVNRSRYGLQLAPYIKLFKRENVLPLIFEEYIADPKKILREVCSFLNISDKELENIDSSVKNQSVGRVYLNQGGKNIQQSFLYGILKPLVPSFLRAFITKGFLHSIEEKPVFSKEVKQVLWSLLERDVALIEEILGRKLDVWREGYDPVRET